MIRTVTEPSVEEKGSGARAMGRKFRVTNEYDEDADVVLYGGDCRDLLKQIERPIFRLCVTSPPYNVGKEYEDRMRLEDYEKLHSQVIRDCYRVILDDGSMCWETGNYVQNGEIIPLDVLLWPYFADELKMKCRNRIIWSIPHGLHSKRRFSGRYETILWFTKGDDYYFNLDEVRVPTLWPKKKYFKGPKKGQYSSNPKGKNPSDVWSITNVKFNHPEKTEHPCQYPEGLIRRLVLALTKPGDWVLDPYLGAGTTAAVCVDLGRKVAGAEIEPRYMRIARERVMKRVALAKSRSTLDALTSQAVPVAVESSAQSQ